MSETVNKCYMIVTADISDREAFMSGYAKAVPALVEQFGGRYVLQARGGEFLEGVLCETPSMVISEWPDRETAQAFWNSDEYAEAKKLREGTGQFQVLLIDAPQING